MDKLNMKTKDITDENINFIESKFPNVITETFDKNGVLKKKVDFIALKQELSNDIVDGTREEYVLTWPGKRDARILANKGINKTLRPCEDESINFDSTKNLYIEGDNLETLKLFRETYLKKIKMIYIDPPYNRGIDSIYKDDYSESSEEYLKETGQINDAGYKIVQNTESNGRFHSDWLSMMYSRIIVAKDLLTDDGVMFVSIDDNELDNLLKIIKEIFSEQNVFSVITIKTNETKGLKNSGVNKSFPKNKEYIICVSKNQEKLNLNSVRILKSDDELRNYFRYYNKYIENINQDCSQWIIKDFNDLINGKNSQEIFKLKKEYSNKLFYLVTPDNLDESKIPNERNRFYKIINNKGNTIYYYRNNSGEIKTALFLNENMDKNLGDLWTDISTININKENCELPTYTDGQKPIKLMTRLINYVIHPYEDDIVLDFFSGSATTAHAVMQLNAEDGGNRRFIMVQIQEAPNDEKISSFLNNINKPCNICELGKERIRRAGQKILNENPSLKGKLDVGFRDFKLDESNMKKVYYSPEEYTQDLLASAENNIREDRTPLDLVFQVMLELGITLDSKIEEKIINDKKVYIIREDTSEESPDLICCFDNDVSEDVVTEIAKLKPLKAVFRDSSMANDNVHINFDQIFETYSPSTERKVL